MRYTTPRPAGFTLIELLVSLLLFSFALLGLVNLEAKATHFTSSAEDSHRAALLANEVAAQMVLRGSIDLETVDPAYLTAWSIRVQDSSAAGLPNGIGTVTIAGTVATIAIDWRAPSAAASSANSTNRYFTEVVLP